MLHFIIYLPKISFFMEPQNFLFSFFCFFFLCFFSGERHGVEGTRLPRTFSPSPSPLPSLSPNGLRPEKLFVFGDSYADTGNTKIADTRSWKFPYGITFPGKPSGRFSDGFVSTDYIASSLGMKTPIPYRWREQLGGRLKHGLNFAYGGTGVFNTKVSEPNMTTQIDFLQQLIHDSVYTKQDLNNSVALVVLSGNDYTTYAAKNGSQADLPKFMESLLNQLAVNLRRIHGFGVRKIGVSSLIPLGCIPQATVGSSFKSCDQAKNEFVLVHNQLLLQAVEALNKQLHTQKYFVVDYYNAFLSIFNRNQTQGSPTFENPLEPCCFQVSKGLRCGAVDENGELKYTLCLDRKSKFFWDGAHPSSQGWRAAYSTPAFQQSLKHFW